MTATDQEKLYWAVQELVQVQAKVKYISLEPLLEWVSPTGWLINHLFRYLRWGGINWLIIGAQTRPTVLPKIAWLDEITEAAGKAGIPVFWKNNLHPLIDDYYRGEYRQEMPEDIKVAMPQGN